MSALTSPERFPKRILFFCLHLTFAALLSTEPLRATEISSTSPCVKIPHADHPKTFLTNGVLDAVIFLPDSVNGYYRGVRFDWAGVVPCVAYKGHTYFGEWFRRYDPMIADAITGPVEEFVSQDGGLGYAEAKAGDPFVKIGVGVLRKTSDDPYRFMASYPLLDGGRRSVKIKGRSITFTQRLRGPNGIAYVYTKTLRIDANRPLLTLEHTIKNTGQTPIDTEVYDHDFYMIDNQTTGPAMTVQFPFDVSSEKPLAPLGVIQGKDLTYAADVGPRDTVSSYLTGFSEKSSDYDITVRNKETGVGVEQTSATPLSKLNFWSIHTTVCPEAYVHLSIPPGKSQSYTIQYRFFADAR